MKKEMNNKGFSLVELIIVIAIMAVLIGLLAPQYIKYVNNSKVSADVTNAQAIASAFNVALADGASLAASYNSGTDAIPTDVNLAAWPVAKHTPTETWTVAIGTNGVTEIKLGTLEIYPEPEATGNYYATRHQ
ncbi:MAG: type II secretion system protein [Lachnospiraceae bacterium]|nr:type II secretion system protein [Lachnospiraceae bacterium]